jgi:Rrf2 family transcriptional regulator, iron-sulfur cluster assembly transcription factor
MKLSTKTRYGARILIELALNGRHDAVQVSKIAARQKIPVKYLEQILRELKQSGLVESTRGPKGGHRLVEDPASISLGQVVRLFEGQTDLVDCISFPENCSMSEDCLIRNAWNEATAVLYEKLDGISIADLIAGSGGKKAAGSQACPSTSDTLSRNA